MRHRVRIVDTFRVDLRAQLSWLARVEEDGWIDGLRDGLDEVIELLALHPRAGALETRSPSTELRRIVLRRVPYVVWYSVGRGKDVWLLRLFHARQRRPTPDGPDAPESTNSRRRPRRKRLR